MDKVNEFIQSSAESIWELLKKFSFIQIASDIAGVISAWLMYRSQITTPVNLMDLVLGLVLFGVPSFHYETKDWIKVLQWIMILISGIGIAQGAKWTVIAIALYALVNGLFFLLIILCVLALCILGLFALVVGMIKVKVD